MKKSWNEIVKEVEAEYSTRYNSVPKDKRRKLGLEPDQRGSYENRQWVQVYIQKLIWKDKCRDILSNPEHYGLQEFKLKKVEEDD